MSQRWRLNGPKNQQRYYSGKQKCHTLKAQIIIHASTRQILSTAFGNERCHDFRLYKETGVKVHPDVELLADQGYQGVKKHHAKSTTPYRKPPKPDLTFEQRQNNRALAKRRIVVVQLARTQCICIVALKSGGFFRVAIETDKSDLLLGSIW